MVVYDRCPVPTMKRIEAHGLVVSCASMVTGCAAVPLAMRLPPCPKVMVALGPIFTTAHGSRVTAATMVVSLGSRCGLAAAVHVSGAVVRPWVVPAPVGAVQPAPPSLASPASP